MKMNKYNILGMVAMAMVFLLSACQDAVELATPNVASPVLVVLEGGAFPADGEVGVSAAFLKLDKSGILDQDVGIDSIPVPDLEITLYVSEDEEIGTWVTDLEGKVMINATWEDLGLSPPVSGEQVVMEIAGSYDNIAFRKYHAVRVE